MAKRRTLKRSKELATILHSRIVRARVGYCQAAVTGVLSTPCRSHSEFSEFQCAHIVRRRFNATRTDLENGWCLCAGHHLVVDTNPDVFLSLVLATCGTDHVEHLQRKKNGPLYVEGVPSPARLFWEHEFSRLRPIAESESASTGYDLLKGIPKA